MDISISNHANVSTASLADLNGVGNAAATGKTAETGRQTLSVSVNDFGAIGDVDATAIPEASLRRDDDLGKLMATAFNFSAPPMPQFV